MNAVFIAVALLLILFALGRRRKYSRTLGDGMNELGKARKNLEDKRVRPRENFLDGRFVILEPEPKLQAPDCCLPLMITAPS